MASQPLGDAADRLRRREVLLRGLFSAFADYSSKAATIFRELAELSEPPGNSKKSAPQRRGASQGRSETVFSCLRVCAATRAPGEA